jgi:hypothetical protein
MATLKEVTARFRRLAAFPVERTLAALHGELLDYARAQFATQGRAGGQPWADYSNEPKSLAYKLALGASPKVLRWEPGKQERLYPSLTDPRDRDHLWQQRGKTVVFGSSLPYLARLEQGGPGPFGERAPGRKILPASVAVRSKVRVALAKELTRQLGLMGFDVEASRG